MKNKRKAEKLMYKIGVIGDKDSIMGFKAVGISVFPVSTPEKLKRCWKK